MYVFVSEFVCVHYVFGLVVMSISSCSSFVVEGSSLTHLYVCAGVQVCIFVYVCI